MPMRPPALLALADGSLFHGESIGYPGVSVGEVVFNTAMTGYQEILTDPSYARQIVTLTYPHIGNTGCNSADAEASSVWASGLVIRDLPKLASNYRNEIDLAEYLYKQRIAGVAGIDTRRLTRLLRSTGAQNACIVTDNRISADDAIAQARAFAGLKGMDLAQEVTTSQAYAWREGTFDLALNGFKPSGGARFKVVAYDFGVKRNILRLLVESGCEVIVVPAKTTAREALALSPDGVFLSNGPGDPEPCDYAIAAIREFLNLKVPQFGICLGHQLLGLAAGAKTLKMKFGHHGANHPVQDLDSKQVMISSQNHGFAVDEATLPKHWRATHRSLFDGSLQGIECMDAPAFGFQGHPEASPGPRDVELLFNRFITLLEKNRAAKAA
jgi:carbamoyl-phosphate synthase small subunit